MGSGWLRLCSGWPRLRGLRVARNLDPLMSSPKHPSPRLPVPMAPGRQALSAIRFNAAPTLPSFLLFQECFMVSVVSIVCKRGSRLALSTCDYLVIVTCSQV